MLGVKGLKPLQNMHYKTVLTHTNLIKTSFSSLFSLHPPLIPPCSLPFSLWIGVVLSVCIAQPLGPGPALPRCKVEMLMLIKSFIWFRLISAALLLSWAVANQIRPSGGPRRADGYERSSLWSPAAVCLPRRRRRMREEIPPCSVAFFSPLWFSPSVHFKSV